VFSILRPPSQWQCIETMVDNCPVHGSRFGKDGLCVMGPAKAGLPPMNESGEAIQQEARGE
jgi:Rieske Fe-S protein